MSTTHAFDATFLAVAAFTATALTVTAPKTIAP